MTCDEMSAHHNSQKASRVKKKYSKAALIFQTDKTGKYKKVASNTEHEYLRQYYLQEMVTVFVQYDFYLAFPPRSSS